MCRGAVCKTAVAGAKDRDSNRVSAAVVERTDAPTLQEFVMDRAGADATVYTDDHSAYDGLLVSVRETVNYSVGEYVRGMAHSNGMESFWAMLKRGYQGTYHHVRPKHLGHYVNEFAGRHNDRCHDTIDQMVALVRGMAGKRLRYRDLVA